MARCQGTVGALRGCPHRHRRRGAVRSPSAACCRRSEPERRRSAPRPRPARSLSAGDGRTAAGGAPFSITVVPPLVVLTRRRRRCRSGSCDLDQRDPNRDADQPERLDDRLIDAVHAQRSGCSPLRHDRWPRVDHDRGGHLTPTAGAPHRHLDRHAERWSAGSRGAERHRQRGDAVTISEFSSGPSGGNDEFVGIYNNTNAAIDISGYTPTARTAPALDSTRATVPLGVILAAHAHYLFVNAAGATRPDPGNVSYATGITDDGGIAIFDKNNVVIDQVGLSSGSTRRKARRWRRWARPTAIAATNRPEARRSRYRTRTTTSPTQIITPGAAERGVVGVASEPDSARRRLASPDR